MYIIYFARTFYLFIHFFFIFWMVDAFSNSAIVRALTAVRLQIVAKSFSFYTFRHHSIHIFSFHLRIKSLIYAIRTKKWSFFDDDIKNLSSKEWNKLSKPWLLSLPRDTRKICKRDQINDIERCKKVRIHVVAESF